MVKNNKAAQLRGLIKNFQTNCLESLQAKKVNIARFI